MYSTEFDLHRKIVPEPLTPEQEALDRRYMRAALRQAAKAAALGEVPIGAVIVCDGQIIGRGYNRRNTDHSTLAHAEITAIRKACRRTGDWRLEGCTLYCTLEPCPMCAGALVQGRIDRVVFGADSPKNGCAGSVLQLLDTPSLNHQAQLTRGVLGDECTKMLQAFFADMRRRRKAEKAAAAAAPADAGDATSTDGPEGAGSGSAAPEISASEGAG